MTNRHFSRLLFILRTLLRDARYNNNLTFNSLHSLQKEWAQGFWRVGRDR